MYLTEELIFPLDISQSVDFLRNFNNALKL